MSADPFDGLSRSFAFSNSLEPAALSADWLAKAFDIMREQEIAENERKVAIAKEYREAMRDPTFAARQDALFTACLEIGCPLPDPLRPPIISPALYARVVARADEIIREGARTE